jgi:outer membrane lipoprotein-sorting protein
LKRFLILLLLITAVLASGCAIPQKKVHDPSITGSPDEINRLLSVITKRNESLETVKGIGKVIVTNRGKSNPIRIAWIASRPDKIRFEMLGIPGHSAATLSFDGEYYYYSSRREEKIFKGESDGSMLESIISISIRAQDVIDILAGRIPLIDFDSAIIERDEEREGYILTLQQDWFGGSQKIYYDLQKIDIKRFEIYSFTGSLEYRVEFEKSTHVNDYLLPFIFSLSNEDGAFFRWETERSYADVPVSPSVFLLTPYGKKEKSHSP